MKYSIVSTLTAFALLAATGAWAGEHHVSSKFSGPKANKGTVTHTVKGGQDVLTLSPDFVIPDTPAPHWQVVDAKGQSYLLQRLKIKGDKVHQSITLPPYIHDVAKVQIWCAWAEVNLGEAAFAQPITAVGK